MRTRFWPRELHSSLPAFFTAEGRHDVERRFPMNLSRGQLREVEAERRRRLPFFSQYGSVTLLKTNWLSISLAVLWSIRRWAWLYRTVFITYISRYNCYCNYCSCYSNFVFCFFTNYNSAYCLSIKRWNLRSFMKNACRALWKRVKDCKISHLHLLCSLYF